MKGLNTLTKCETPPRRYYADLTPDPADRCPNTCWRKFLPVRAAVAPAVRKP